MKSESIPAFQVRIYSLSVLTLYQYFRLFKRFVDEEAQKIDKGQKHADHNRELSVFEKLVAIDKKLALNMTIDMLTAGIDTVSIRNRFMPGFSFIPSFCS